MSSYIISPTDSTNSYYLNSVEDFKSAVIKKISYDYFYSY